MEGSTVDWHRLGAKVGVSMGVACRMVGVAG